MAQQRDPEYRTGLDFHVAYLHGSQSTLEGPWYGLYNHILNDIIFPNICSDMKWTTTRTYPQYPLTLDTDAGNDDEPDNDLAGLSEPSTPPRASSLQPTQSSPGTIVSYSPGYVLPNQGAGHAIPGRHGRYVYREPQTPPPPESRKSTRIPDFAEIVHQMNDKQMRSFFLMLTEIKKKPTPNQDNPRDIGFLFVKALEQVTYQAYHAFNYSQIGETFKQVKIIGAIVGIGKYWKYVEFHRSQIEQLSNTPHSQRSYVPSSASSSGSTDSDSELRYYTEVEKVSRYYLRGCKFTRIDSEESDQALRRVRARMYDLSHM